MNPSSQPPSMPVMPITPTILESGNLLTNPSLPSGVGYTFRSQAPSPSTDEEDYYHPFAMYSSIYDTDIDHTFDLNPKNPIALSNFLTRIDLSISAAPSRDPSSTVIGGVDGGSVEYDANDEDSMEGMEFDTEYEAEGVSVIFEEDGEDVDGDGKGGDMSQLEFIRYMNGEWPVDPHVAQEAEYPAIAGSVISSDSNFSCRSPRHTSPGRLYYAHHERNASNEIELSSIEPHSSETTPSPGTVEFHERVAGPSYYPEATQFFAVDRATEEFANPFTIRSSGNAATPESVPSPRTMMRVNDYGLIENWNFEARDEREGSLVSSLSNYSQFVDDDLPVSLPSEHGTDAIVTMRPLEGSDESWESRKSGVFWHLHTNTPQISALPHNRFSSISSASSSYSSSSSSDSELLFVPEPNTQLNELIFKRAAYEFFSPINVKALAADQDSTYTFVDHDNMHHPWELELEWPYRYWLPHKPRRRHHYR